jgi:hypothetical protein
MTNPIAAAVLAALPATNTNGTSLSNNYEALLLIRDYSDKYDAKLDYQINDKMTMFLRFDQRKDLQYYQPDITGLAGGDGNGYIHAIQQQAAVGYTWTVSPTSLFEARLGFSHVLAGKQPAYLGSPSPIMSGFEGLPTAANVAGGLDSQSITGFSLLGRQATNPQFQNPTDWNPKFNYSHVMGRHTLKAGYEFLMIRTEVLDINPLYGEDFYNGQYSTPGCAGLGMPAGCSLPAVPTGVSSATATTNYNLADFMFGTPSQIALGNNQVTNLRQHVHGMYVQDDWHVNSKLTVNLGLRYEFATPLWERDNLWSNFDPTTNTLVRATSGSLYDRALVNPDHSDWGPRIGLAYSVTPTTVLRGGYGISYDFFNRPGSAEEGINGPLSIFGVINQTSPVGNPSFLTTQNSFTTNIASPASFNPILSNIDYIPANTKWPYVQSWFFSLQHELNKDTVLELGYNGNHSLRLPIIGDYNQANVFVTGGPTGIQQRRPDQSFGAITWVDPAGDNDYNGVSLRLEHRLGGGLYFLNSFTWSKALGDSEQALEYYAGGVEANPQNMYNLGAERGPASFDVKLLNVSSMVYQLPFGHGRQFGSNMNRVADAIVGGWEVNSIITAQTGVPLNVYYSPSTAANLTGLSADYRGEEFLRPNVTGSWVREVTNSMINSYFNGYTFTTPPTTDPFGDAGRDAFRAPGLIQWDFAANKSFRITESKSLQFRSEFFNFTNHTNFGLPNVTSNSSSFGQIRTTYPARQVQFALKFLF